MKNKFMLIVVVVALLAVGWATFPAFAQGANGHGNGNGSGNQSQADAGSDDANETDDRAQERQDRAEARHEARQERQEAREERRAALNESIQLHRDCIRAAVLEKREAHPDTNTTDGNTTDGNATAGNNTDGNTTDDRSPRSEAVRECNHTFRDQVHEINSAARERYQLAKERMKEQYGARLDQAREERGNGAACREDDTCADRRVAKWEERKERAEERLSRLQADLNMTQNDLAALGASGNATAEEVFELEDKAASLGARIAQVERMIERIEAKIDDWRDAGTETA